MFNRWEIMRPVKSMMNGLYTLRIWLVAIMLALMVTACGGIPVQEMSDARQALQAAAEVGAKEKASTLYTEADQLLEQAEIALNGGEYKKARQLADKAKEKAIMARKQSVSGS
jgi:hypothetical protein